MTLHFLSRKGGMLHRLPKGLLGLYFSEKEMLSCVLLAQGMFLLSVEHTEGEKAV